MIKTANITGITFLALCLTANSQGIVLNTGDSYTYEFQNMSYWGTTPYVFLGAQAVFSLDPSTLSPGYEMQFEVFESRVTEIPLSSDVRSASDPFVGFDLPGAMLDLQGVVRFAMLAGSGTLDSFDLSVFVPLQTGGSAVYFQEVYPTPEPSGTTLLMIVAASIALLRRMGIWRRRAEGRPSLSPSALHAPAIDGWFNSKGRL